MVGIPMRLLLGRWACAIAAKTVAEAGIVEFGFLQGWPVTGAQGGADDDHRLAPDTGGAALVADVGQGAAQYDLLPRPTRLVDHQHRGILAPARRPEFGLDLLEQGDGEEDLSLIHI